MSTDAPEVSAARINAANPFRGLPIGWPVNFFVTGDRAHLPAPAIVFRCHGNGVLDLCEFRWGADQKQRSGVRHITDPVLRDNEKLKQTAGAWDYVPGLVVPDNIPIFTSGFNPDGFEIEVMTMAAEGRSTGDIAAALSIAAKKVKEIIERYSASLP